MSSAGRAVSSSGCVARPRGREIGLIGFAAQIRRSSLIGSYVMETAENREPCESRGSRTVLGARGGEIPPRDSTYDESADLLAQSPFVASNELGKFLRRKIDPLVLHSILDPWNRVLRHRASLNQFDRAP